MVLHFAAAVSGLSSSDTEGCVKGSFTDALMGNAYRFFGCDSVVVVP